MNITLEQFRKTIPTNTNPQEWYAVLPAFFKKYEINTRNRVAAFLAQTGHEAMDWRVVNENLNYSEAGLLKTFGRYYRTPGLAAQHARKPETIANWVYDDRNPARTNKLGNTQNGDGWKFRGGGIKQLTGRFNYTAFGKDIGMTADEVAAYVRTPAGALESAGWFWKKNNLQTYADRDDIVGMTKAINGGTIGLPDRQARYARAKSILPPVIDLGTTGPVSPVIPPVVVEDALRVVAKFGDKSEVVKTVQRALKLTADGDFGKNTKAAVESWQRNNRFPVTGQVTHRELDKMVGL